MVALVQEGMGASVSVSIDIVHRVAFVDASTANNAEAGTPKKPPALATVNPAEKNRRETRAVDRTPHALEQLGEPNP